MRCGSFVFTCQMPWGGQAGPRAERGEVGEFIKAREAARLPEDAGGFWVCGEVVT